MNLPINSSSSVEIPPQKIEQLIGLLTSLDSEIQECESQYYSIQYTLKSLEEFDFEHWWNRFFILGVLCTDIVTFGAPILQTNIPGGDFKLEFYGVEQLFTYKPTEASVFVEKIGFLRVFLLPIVLALLHALKNGNKENTDSQILLSRISVVVNDALTGRGEPNRLIYDELLR